MNEFYGQQVAKLRQSYGGTEQAVRQFQQYAAMQQQAAVEREFDEFIAGLGAEGEKLFGKGPSAALSRTSPEFARRQRLAQQAEDIGASVLRRKETVPNMQIFRKAYFAEFGDTIERTATDKVRGKVAESKKRMVNRPTQRKAPESEAQYRNGINEKALREFQKLVAENEIT